MDCSFPIDRITSPITTSSFVDEIFSLGLFSTATLRYQPAASARRPGFLFAARLFFPSAFPSIIGV